VLGTEAQVEITEAHHAHKVDAPSGTALAFGEQIAQVRGESLQQLISYDADATVQNHAKDKIGFNVVREGEIIGEHVVLFNLPGEQLTIEHKATDRTVFAAGAIHAAKWLAGRSPSWYQMRDVLDINKYLQE
jgi:4-hydroxy-tetrahydrodipicolinate reductase